MNQRRRAIATAILIAAVAIELPAAIAGAAGGKGASGGNKELQDLKRQVNQMRAEVQALQVAVSEAAELDRQRNARLSRALKEEPAPSQPVPPPPAAPPPAGESENDAREPAPAPAPAAAPEGKDKGNGPSRRRRHRRSGRARAATAKRTSAAD